jgi:hypothetical protein
VGIELHSAPQETTGDLFMAIGSAIERGSVILVYNKHGHMLFSKPKGSGPQDRLLGFIGSTVTVQAGSNVFTYGEHGQILYGKSA